MNLCRLASLLLLISLSCLQGQDAVGTIAPVEFSLRDQTFAESMVLELSCSTEGAVIRYSTDGNPLTLFNSAVYTKPLTINGTTWIRAQASVSKESSVITSGHYIHLAEDVRDFESPLPILVLENFGQGRVPSKDWNQTGAGVQQVARQRAQWFLFDRDDEDGISRLQREPNQSARLGVRVRGAFSSSFPRKPFSVEAWDEEDQETAIKPLGMPKESDWVLYPPNAVQDRTLLYNTWLYDLSRSIGGNAMRFRFTEAFVHTDGGSLSMDDHAGVYVILEKVKRDGNRLDFPQLSEDGKEGGWLLSINRMDPIPVGGYPTANGATEPQFFHTAGPNRNLQTSPNQAGRGDDIPRQGNAFINFESPNGYAINEAQRDAIEGWFETFEDVLYSNHFRDPVNGYRRYLNVDSFVDYFILHDITRNTDGLLISMWVYKEGPEAKLKMGPVWDYDLAYKSTATSSLAINRDRLWYARLWQDPDFEQRYSDRWQELRAGPLSDEAIHARIDSQAAEITEEVASRHGVSSWGSRLTIWKNWITDRAAAIDKKFEPRPKIVQPSGKIHIGARVSLKAGTIFSARDIYVTTDGTDPRAPGGAVADQASLLDSSVSLEKSTQIRGRVLHKDTWSGLVEAWYFVEEEPVSIVNLGISKIHYHPSDPTAEEIAAGFDNDDDFEFLEFRNLSEQTLHLGGAQFSDGIDFTFGAETISPQDRVLLVRNREAFERRYGNALPVVGEYEGSLRNSGESLRLLDFGGNLIEEIEFNDRGSWPRSADGDGPSLVRMESSSNGPFAWRPSVSDRGAPGIDDQLKFDGVSNLIEFALGSRTPVNVSREEDTDRAVFSYQRNLAAHSAIFVETSSDLLDWTVLDAVQIDRQYLTLGTAEERLSVPKEHAGAFYRLRIESP